LGTDTKKGVCRMKKMGMATAVLALAALLARAETTEWMTDFDAAQKKAAEKKLPILADFSGSDWCGWCIRLDKEVFSQKEFREYAKTGIVLFLADFPQRKKLPAKLVKQNERLSGKYAIKGFPTVLLLDAKGKVLARTGYQEGGAKAYVEHLKQLLASATTQPGR